MLKDVSLGGEGRGSRSQHKYEANSSTLVRGWQGARHTNQSSLASPNPRRVENPRTIQIRHNCSLMNQPGDITPAAWMQGGAGRISSCQAAGQPRGPELRSALVCSVVLLALQTWAKCASRSSPPCAGRGQPLPLLPVQSLSAELISVEAHGIVCFFDLFRGWEAAFWVERRDRLRISQHNPLFPKWFSALGQELSFSRSLLRDPLPAEEMEKKVRIP